MACSDCGAARGHLKGCPSQEPKRTDRPQSGSGHEPRGRCKGAGVQVRTLETQRRGGLIRKKVAAFCNKCQTQIGAAVWSTWEPDDV